MSAWYDMMTLRTFVEHTGRHIKRAAGSEIPGHPRRLQRGHRRVGPHAQNQKTRRLGKAQRHHRGIL